MEKKQRDLFEVEPEPWEIDDQDTGLIAQVALPLPPFGILDYRVPDSLAAQAVPGVRLDVPLGRGNRTVRGYCIRQFHSGSLPPNQRPNLGQLKAVHEVVDRQPLLTQRLIDLAQQISDYYVCPLGTVLDTVVPHSVRRQAGTRSVQFYSLAETAGTGESRGKLTAKQSAVIAVLEKAEQAMPMSWLCDQAGCGPATVRSLCKRGLIAVTSQRIRTRSAAIAAETKESNHPLNNDQADCLVDLHQQINAGEHATTLIHGITSSGKTEVYIRAIQRAIEFGRQAIVLVPEISLTPQTRQRFRARFDKVAVLHSHLSDVDRAWHWNEIREGRIQVVIGARSAVFAPLPNLGIIVIDEEHDTSFKQDSAPRYHAREVARWRADRENCPLVLGSATPSLETWHRAQQSEIRLASLPQRIHARPLPEVRTLDLRTEFANRRQRGAVSRQLHVAMREALEERGQVILLLNRRGFATSILCPSCGEAIYCPDCAIPLTHHRAGRKAVCHYCDHQIPEPQYCPKCRSADIRFLGFGTQKLEEEVRARFPDYAVARMDTDTMSKPGSHEQTLNEFRAGKIQILLGTQMIAKGLDFPNVTLVGVVNADTAIHLPDFRAAERSFALITQVAGRSGRGPKGGRVLVQTFSPEHPAIGFATEHDFPSFAEHELRQRQENDYPPFTQMARVVIRSRSLTAAQQLAEEMVRRVQAAAVRHALAARVVGPAPAPVEKLRGKHRVHFLIQFMPGDPIQQVLAVATENLPVADDTQWTLDVDPLDMM